MPIEISIQNALCQIKNLPNEVHDELTVKLRFMDQATEFSHRNTVKRIKRLNELLGDDRFKSRSEDLQKELRQCLHIIRGLEDKLWIALYDSEGYFPTGLLPRVIEVLKKNQLEYLMKDKREKPKQEFKFVLQEDLPALRYYQKTAVRQLLEQHRGIVVMPTGTGKTKTACRMIEMLGVKTLVLTPGKSISQLMLNDLTKHFGKGKVQKLTTKNVKTKAINVINIQALNNLDPKIFEDIRAVIIDEFHHAAADTYLYANEEHLKNCYYRIGLTATNFRNDGADLALEAVLSNVLYEYEIKQAIKDGFLLQPKFEIVQNVLNEEPSYQKAYKNQIVDNELRNRKIVEIAEKHKSDSVLILVKQIEHGEILQKMLPKSAFIQGETKDSDRDRIMDDFRKGVIKCLIGTTVIGEGVDLPIANVLVMAASGKARSQIMQNIGRVLRIQNGKKNPVIYDFTDQDGSWLEEHSNLRQEVYQIY